jgi:hypothetical protein
MPVEAGKLDGVGAWLQASSNLDPSSHIPPRLYRGVFGLMALGWVAFVQAGLVYRVLISPLWALPLWLCWVGFAIDEGLLVAWTIYLVRAFHAGKRPTV